MAQIEYRQLGRSGLTVSTIGLGCNNFGRRGAASESQEGTTAVIDAAIEAGVTLFDTAEMYGGEFGLSERLMGIALKGKRDRIVLASKFGNADYPSPFTHGGATGSRRYVRFAVEESLRRLQTDWIDLYQLHTPDPRTPVEETLAALDELITEGKVRYIGHSNLSSWQLVEADYLAGLHGHPRFISAQNEYNLLTRAADDELLPAAEKYGVGFLPWYPLFNGVFTGKYSRSGGPADSRIMRSRKHLLGSVPWDAFERYEAFCAERGISILDATFAWLLAQPALSSVIAGATRAEQIVQNANSATAWTPSAEELAEINELFPR